MAWCAHDGVSSVSSTLSFALTYCDGADRRRAFAARLSYQNERAYQRSQMDHLYRTWYLYRNAPPPRLDCDDCWNQIGRKTTVIDFSLKKEVAYGSQAR